MNSCLKSEFPPLPSPQAYVRQSLARSGLEGSRFTALFNNPVFFRNLGMLLRQKARGLHIEKTAWPRYIISNTNSGQQLGRSLAESEGQPRFYNRHVPRRGAVSQVSPQSPVILTEGVMESVDKMLALVADVRKSSLVISYAFTLVLKDEKIAEFLKNEQGVTLHALFSVANFANSE